MQCRSCDADLTPGARFCASCAAPAPSAAPDPADSQRTALEDALGFQYQVQRLLGRGGMGSVYLATELALDREVAIKVLHPDRGQDDDARPRFRREARTAARLVHPGIVPLLTFGEVKGLIYYVMGYVRGESLAARMRREGRLATRTVVGILGDVADALDYAHRHGVVHRDIKPDNVLIDEESGRALLTDFGIARSRDSETLTATGMVVGTPRYMSPEQAGGSADLDGRSDIYSLGLIGYEMVTGASPFDGRTPGEQILQRVTRDPTPLPTRAPDAPAWLSTAIGRCLERSPDGRWKDAGALRDQLRSAGGDDGDLPAALQNLSLYAQVGLAGVALGTGIILWDLATGALQRWFLFRGRFDPEPPLFAAFLVIPLVALVALDARRKGQPWGAIGAAFVRQPRWWIGWYPRVARLPGDVWDRLPRHLRAVRTLLLLGLALFAYLFLIVRIEDTAMDLYNRFGTRSRMAAFLYAHGWDTGLVLLWPLLAYLIAVPVSWFLSFRKLRQGPLAGLDNADIWPVFARATANVRFWSKPIYRSLLEPMAPQPAAAIRPPTPQASASPDAATATRQGPQAKPEVTR